MCWRLSGAAVMCVVVLGSEGAVGGHLKCTCHCKAGRRGRVHYCVRLPGAWGLWGVFKEIKRHCPDSSSPCSLDLPSPARPASPTRLFLPSALPRPRYAARTPLCFRTFMLSSQSLRDTLKEIIPAKQEQLKKLVRVPNLRVKHIVFEHAFNHRKPSMATPSLAKSRYARWHDCCGLRN